MIIDEPIYVLDSKKSVCISKGFDREIDAIKFAKKLSAENHQTTVAVTNEHDGSIKKRFYVEFAANVEAGIVTAFVIANRVFRPIV